MLRLAALLSLWGTCAGAASGYYAYSVFAAQLPPDLTAALDYHPARASRVYSADGEVIGEFFLQKRVVVPLERIPAHVRQAFISAEDSRFWSHPGFDLMGIVRAARANFQGGAISQGASTITQQVMRMLMLEREREFERTFREEVWAKYDRKVKELILSWRVEHELDKPGILHLYLNHVYLGHGAYGVQAAAEIYFGKDVEHVTLAEGAMLAGLPQSPSRYSPVVSFERARTRQRYVLDRMVDDGALTVAEADAAYAEPIALIESDQPLNAVSAPYFVEQVRRWATERYGHRNLFYGGLRIHTTLDSRLQRAAETAVRDGLRALDRDLGFRGTLGHLEGDELAAFTEGPPRPYVRHLDEQAISGTGVILADVPYVGAVTEVREAGWKSRIVVDVGPRELRVGKDDLRTLQRWRGANRERIAVGDLLPVRLDRDDDGEEILSLAQEPDVQAAMVAIEHATGRIEALVGGYDYARSQFNRVTQARRQAGSSIKPFIYAAALERGYHHLSIVRDAPVRVQTASGVWAPSNYKPEYLGSMTLRTALAKSINTVSVRLVLDVGVDPVVDMMRRLGVRSQFPRHISIALGTPDVTLLEMVSGIAAFPNGGKRVDPRFIELVTTDDGVVLEDHRKERPTEQVISPQLAYLMVELMKVVVERGTGRSAQALGWPAGGKTGTSTEFRDAWFIGYTPARTGGVWVGRDDFTPIGDKVTGGGNALPIWLQYMQVAHQGETPREFEVPPDVLFVRASETTGMPLPPGAGGAALVPYMRGTVPDRFMSAPPSDFGDSGSFMPNQ